MNVADPSKRDFWSRNDRVHSTHAAADAKNRKNFSDGRFCQGNPRCLSTFSKKMMNKMPPTVVTSSQPNPSSGDSEATENRARISGKTMPPGNAVGDRRKYRSKTKILAVKTSVLTSLYELSLRCLIRMRRDDEHFMRHTYLHQAKQKDHCQ
jgi:hypothetical protein